jgi:ferredoxin
MAELKITVDLDRCVGSTMCVYVAPDVFELDAKRQASVASPEGATTEVIVDAAAQCPMEAITVIDAATGQELFPG